MGTTNSVAGAISPISRYLREFEPRLLEEQRECRALGASWMGHSKERELRGENTPGGREARRLALKEMAGNVAVAREHCCSGDNRELRNMLLEKIPGGRVVNLL